jgi:hypothetical protein
MSTVVSLQVERVAVDFVEVTSPLSTVITLEIDLGVNSPRTANSYSQLQTVAVVNHPVNLFRSELEGSGGIYVVGTVDSGERYKLGLQQSSIMQVVDTPVEIFSEIAEALLLVDSPRPPTSEIETPITIGPTGPTGPTSDFYWGN